MIATESTDKTSSRYKTHSAPTSENPRKRRASIGKTLYFTRRIWQGLASKDHLVMGFNIVTKNTVRDRFKPAPRPALWKDVEPKDWNNWIWQQQKRIKSMEQLEALLPPTQEERDAFKGSHEQFNMGITPYYASLMDPNDENCPIRLQSVPKMGELNILSTDWEDPLQEERDMPVP